MVAIIWFWFIMTSTTTIIIIIIISKLKWGVDKSSRGSFFVALILAGKKASRIHKTTCDWLTDWLETKSATQTRQPQEHNRDQGASLLSLSLSLSWEFRISISHTFRQSADFPSSWTNTQNNRVREFRIEIGGRVNFHNHGSHRVMANWTQFMWIDKGKQH